MMDDPGSEESAQSHIDEIHAHMRETSEKLNDMLEHGLRVYEDQVDSIERETKAKIVRAQDSFKFGM
eukprot:1385608-Karenia_brevis.AAC.1